MRLGGASRTLPPPFKGGTVAVRPIIDASKGRFDGVFLIAAVVLVQVAWGAGLVLLALHFL